MTIFFLKSILSLVLLLFALYNVYTMFEVFGGKATTEAAALLKRRHKISGYGFVVLFALLVYLCVGFLAASRSEPSARTALHVLLALGIAAIFIVKVLFIHRYRQFYAQARTIGIVMGILTFVLVGISGGFYLVVSHFGRDLTVDKSAFYAVRGPFLAVRQIANPAVQPIRTDPLSIARGKALFAARCSACHDPSSTRTIVGPGLKGVLKNPKLPVSGHPATPASIRFQLRQPMGRMPSFAYLSDDEMSDLIAYLNTL